MKPIKQIKIKKGMKVSELMMEIQDIGMQAGNLAKSASIMEEMIKDKNCTVFFGQAGALIPGGMRNILIDMLEKKWINVFVTTGATLTHDMIEALGFRHYQGHSAMNDEKLNKQGLVRMYNSLMQDKAYIKLEKFFEKNFENLAEKETIKEFLWKIGEILAKEKKRSILSICYKKKIPIFCPAISDSGIGLMVWGRIVNGKKINVGAFDDLKEILDISWTAKKTGVVYLGGGVPKNYIQQAMQFSRKASYGVQITTSHVESGGSSGAPLKEGISWGKMHAKAKYVDVFCDATIALPLIYATLRDRLR